MTLTKSLFISTAVSLLLIGCGSSSNDKGSTKASNNISAETQKELDALKKLNEQHRKALEDLQSKVTADLQKIRNDSNASTQAAIDAFKLKNDAKIQELINTGLLTKEQVYDLLFNKSTLANVWYEAGVAYVEKKDLESFITSRGAAKNVILFVGDGMGVSTVTAARILDGQQKGGNGEENMLSFDKFPIAGLSKTYNSDSQTPDSAGTMSAMVTGVKTRIGVLSVSDAVDRGDCNASKLHPMTTIVELAEDLNMSTGVVSTARLTHATPAATYAHSADRNWEHSAGGDCKDIATQFVEFSHGDGIDVALGGGRREFMPNTAAPVEGKSGKRTDGRDLRQEWKTKYPTGHYVENLSEFNAVDTSKGEKLFGLFNYSHMQYEADRMNDVDGEPSLSMMTEKAIKILKHNPKGFFLMVESGRIDHAHHAGNAYGALTDTIEMAKAVDVADKLTDDKDTLIIVTADHSHVFTIAGYPVRGNPILGKVRSSDGKGGNKGLALAADDKPYTTLGYNNGRGFMNLGSETDSDKGYSEPIYALNNNDNGRAEDLTGVDTNAPGFHQEATVPRSSETHAGEDVGIYAKGPGANLLSGTNEQNMIFHVMEHMGNYTNK
jgi:alkaline phosphatase